MGERLARFPASHCRIPRPLGGMNRGQGRGSESTAVRSVGTVAGGDPAARPMADITVSSLSIWTGGRMGEEDEAASGFEA